MKNKLILIATLLYSGASAASDGMQWFKNETTCRGASITVRSYCEESDHKEMVNPVNTMCTAQQLRIQVPGKKSMTFDLLKHETDRNNWHIARSLRCVSAANKPYLLISMGNGGSCDTCEVDGIMDMKGRWKRYGGRWLFATKSERTAIAAQEMIWYRQDDFSLNNMTRD